MKKLLFIFLLLTSPVFADQFGNTSKYTDSTTSYESDIVYTKVTSTSAGTMDSLVVHCLDPCGQGPFDCTLIVMALYTDNGGVPGTPIDSTATTYCPFNSPGDWVQVEVIVEVSITASTTYWLGVQMYNTWELSMLYAQGAAAGNSRKQNNQARQAWEIDPTTQSLSFDFSFYGVYTPSVGAEISSRRRKIILQ